MARGRHGCGGWRAGTQERRGEAEESGQAHGGVDRRRENGLQQYCKFCHNEDGTGNGALAPKDTHPPNLIDAKWDHGSTDGEIFTNIKEGIGPKFDMKPMKTKMMDTDIWNVVNYLRSLAKK